MAEYISTLTGQEMDVALTDMNNHVSEAWAVGTRGGQAVQPSDETYHNNAKYYAESISTTLAPAYDSTATYAVGDLVTYQGVVYECTTAVTTPEAFDPSNWQVFNLTALKAEIQAQMNTKAPIITDTASGAIASFPDGADSIPVESLISYINPLQDLHEQSNPYPNGGGKNKLPTTLADIKSNNTAGTWNGNAYTHNGVTFTIQTDAAGNVTGIKATGTASGRGVLNIAYDFGSTLIENQGYILSGCPSGGSNSTYRLYTWNTPSYSINVFDTGSGATFTYATVAGNTINTAIFVESGYAIGANGIMFYPMIRLATETDATFAPYSNICPISGYTGVNIQHAGKNLFPFPYSNTSGSSNGLTWTVRDNGEVFFDGGKTASARVDFRIFTPISTQRNLINRIAGKQVIGSGCPSGGGQGSYVLSCQGFALDGIGVTDTGNGTSVINVSNNIETFNIVQAYIIIFAGYTIPADGLTFKPMLRLATEDDTYDAPKTTTNISWQTEAGTVYFGTLEYLGNGEWKLTATYGEDDLGTFTWTKGGGNPSVPNILFYADAPSNCKANGTRYTAATNVLTSQYKPIIRDDLYSVNGIVGIAAEYNYNYITDPNLNSLSAADFKTAMSGVQYVYELATPIEYTLTGPDPETLYGTNNWWNDCNGNITIEYAASTKLYIDKKIAEAISG